MNRIANNRLGFYYARQNKTEWECRRCRKILATSRRAAHLRTCDPRAYKRVIIGEKYDPYEPAEKVGRRGKIMAQQEWFRDLKTKMRDDGIIRP